MSDTAKKISAKDIMALRQRTGLGMMDCKEALVENGGDMDAALEWLRTKLKGKMDERTDREMAQGRLAIAMNDDRTAVAVIEVNVETDFTARNDMVAQAADQIAQIALKGPAGDVSKNDEITAIIDNIRITTGENATFKRGVKLEGPCVGSYLHFDNLKSAVAVFTGEVDEDTAKGVCMHIVSHVPIPLAVSEDQVDADLIERQRKIALQEAEESGKPPEIAQKMVEGKMRKFAQEVTLLNQNYVRDPEGKQRVKDALPKDVTITEFARIEIGVA